MPQMESIKKTRPSTLDRITSPEVLEEDRYVDWISTYGWYVLVGTIGLFALLFLIYRTGGNTKAESDYFNAERSMTILETQGLSRSGTDALRQIKFILKRRPELHSKYDAALAQILMVQGLQAEASGYANSTLERLVGDDLSLYNDFSKTTLLINEGKTEEGLQSSQALKNQMLDSSAISPMEPTTRSFGDLLFAYNQLRIAMLHQALGQSKLETQSWEEWQKFAKGEFTQAPESLINPASFQMINYALTIGDLSLNDYIAHRLSKDTVHA